MTNTDGEIATPVRRRGKAPKRTPGGFIRDKEALASGVILFRRTDVQHNNWYCRVKLPKAERYKTFSLKTDKIIEARELADDHAREIKYQIKHDIPVFDRPFLSVAREYLATQEERASRHEISEGRTHKMRSIIEQALNRYIGSTQVSKIGQETWDGYPAWRRANGRGRNSRNGTREVSGDLADALIEQDKAARRRAREARGLHPTKRLGTKNEPVPDLSKPVPFISDSTIRFEMSIFGAVMNYAIRKKYAPASQRFNERPKLKVMRRDAFTRDEYSLLHTKARKWIDEDEKAKGGGKTERRPSSLWYRTVAYNFVLIMCNTGMRPSEAKNLRWGDISPAKDKDGREIVVLFVQGKGTSRKLVAPQSVLGYLNRIREIARTKDGSKKDANGKPSIIVGNPEHDDFVFTTHTGERADSLYQGLIENLLDYAKLREGSNGIPRSTYCFRHTYATFRLSEGVDVYFLAEQMGTSVKMIEDHYGHVNTIRHADRVLQGMGGWEDQPKAAKTPKAPKAEVNAAHAVAAKVRTSPKARTVKH